MSSQDVRRRPLPAVALLAAVLLAAGPATAGCGAAPAASGAATPTLAATARADQELAVEVAGRRVSPPTGRITVRKGSTLRLVVTSDVADELHIHGYDVTAALPAGTPVPIAFVADRDGLFEVEVHSGLQLCQLQVG